MWKYMQHSTLSLKNKNTHSVSDVKQKGRQVKYTFIARCVAHM